MPEPNQPTTQDRSLGGRAHPDLEGALKHLLDSHGYSFQYAVLRAFEELVKEKHVDWHFEVAEFPVENRGADTRIDFIISQTYSRFILVCECKRANPALRDWVFLKTPYRTPEAYKDRSLSIEYMTRDDGAPAFTTIHSYEQALNVYDLAVELRGHAKGDAGGRGRGAIEEACTQLIRGVQGYFNFRATMASKQKTTERRFVFPVVFTTAALWEGAPPLHMADLRTGELPETPAITRQPWVWYQFPVSPGLRNMIGQFDAPETAGAALREIYTRSVAIVNPENLGGFLEALSHLSIAHSGSWA